MKVRVPLVAALIAATLGLLALGGAAANIFGGFRLQSTDRLFPTGVRDDRIVVVGIDTASLDQVGQQWPWTRDLHADIVRKLDRAGVELIVYDVIFNPAAQNDPALAEALGSADVVLGALADLEPRVGRRLPVAVSVVDPVPALEGPAVGVGHTNVSPDPGDGVVRSLPLLVEDTDGDLILSLALASFTEHQDLDGPLTVRPSGLQVADRFVPTGDLGVLDIGYAPGLAPNGDDDAFISAGDVLGDRFDRDLAGKIAVVGVTDPTLGDNRLTPVEKSIGMPGVHVHANALNTLLTRSYLMPASAVETAVWSMAIAFVVGLLALVLPFWIAGPGTLGVVGLYLVLAAIRFDTGSVMDVIYPPLAGVVAFIVAVALRYVSERRERDRVSALFSQYVPDSVARQLLDADAAAEATQVKRAEVTVLFCDLRGFTATAATLEPADVGQLLEGYYEATTDLVFKHGGTLMQYVGDEVYALFGAPIEDPSSHETALACALDFQRAAPYINARLAEQRLPAIAYGIGLHTGEVVTAHIGTARRRQFSAIGDTVNCGARLCSLANPGEVIVSGELYERLADPPAATALAPILLKGVSRDLRPFRIAPDKAARRPRNVGKAT